MGGSKPRPVQTPFQQTQQQQNTYGTMSIADSPEAKSLLSTPLDFGQGQYTGKAYEDIPTQFNLDPGVGHRTGLAEQGVNNRYNSAFNAGVPAWIREMNRARDVRDVQGQGAAEAQQAEYGRQQLQNQALTTRAQMRDQSELAKAGLTGQATAAELERQRLLLPQILQTGGSGSSSGYNTQIQPAQQGFLGQFAQSAGAKLGGFI